MKKISVICLVLLPITIIRSSLCSSSVTCGPNEVMKYGFVRPLTSCYYNEGHEQFKAPANARLCNAFDVSCNTYVQAPRAYNNGIYSSLTWIPLYPDFFINEKSSTDSEMMESFALRTQWRSRVLGAVFVAWSYGFMRLQDMHYLKSLACSGAIGLGLWALFHRNNTFENAKSAYKDFFVDTRMSTLRTQIYDQSYLDSSEGELDFALKQHCYQHNIRQFNAVQDRLAAGLEARFDDSSDLEYSFKRPLIETIPSYSKACLQGVGIGFAGCMVSPLIIGAAKKLATKFVA